MCCCFMIFVSRLNFLPNPKDGSIYFYNEVNENLEVSEIMLWNMALVLCFVNLQFACTVMVMYVLSVGYNSCSAGYNRADE